MGQVGSLAIGTQVFIKFTGRGWEDYEREYEGLYRVGRGQELWSDDCKNVYYIYEMNMGNYEFEVYVPDIRYKMNTVIKDIKEIMNLNDVTTDEIISKIRKAIDVS